MLYLKHFHGTLEQHFIERLIGKSRRGGCTRESFEITNKPFFMPARKADAEEMDV